MSPPPLLVFFVLRDPLVDNRGNRRLALRRHHLQRLLVAHRERQRERGALLVLGGRSVRRDRCLLRSRRFRNRLLYLLQRTSRLCAAKAKELERMAKADGDMPAPCCTQTQDQNQPPVGRPILASSESEMRTYIRLCFSDALRGILGHEKAR